MHVQEMKTMTKRRIILNLAASTAFICGGVVFAQAPVVNIDAHKHPNLARAQSNIVQAYQLIDRAQSANRDELGGHGQKAKELLMQADAELRAAANVSNQEHR
jgi:N-acetylmuramic acid 6-phosphate (MurNAc-6-P) etherase